MRTYMHSYTANYYIDNLAGYITHSYKGMVASYINSRCILICVLGQRGQNEK